MSQASEAGGGGPFDPVFEREPLGGGGAALDVVVATVQGQRGSQEDAHLIHAFKGDEHKVGDSDAVLVGVYDGHGGSFVSKYVAHNMVRCLGILAADDVSEWPSPNPAAGLAAAYKLLDGELFAGAEPVLAAAKAVGPRMRNPTRKLQKMGTTALTTVTATVDGEKRLYFANLGDCRLVLDRGATKTTEVLTTDHKPSDPAEQARIEANGGVVVNGQLNSEIGVARALGDIKFKKKGEGDDGEASSLISCTAEIGYAVVGAADRFAVIACDGVWDVMSSDEVGEMVRTMLDGGQDQDAICSAVIKECFDRDTKDNMTLALITMF